MFAIELETEERPDPESGQCREVLGKITLGNSVDWFRAPLGFWEPDDYRRSWCQAYREIERDENAYACLMTSMSEPEHANFLFCWPLYRKGDDVHIQNAMIFMEEVTGEFDPNRPWRHLGSRLLDREGCAIDEDGNKVSEWTLPFSDMRVFFKDLCSKTA